MEQQKPRIWTCVFLVKWGKVLLGKRIGKFGNGEWWSPGGHLEFGEKVEECMIREVFEETGIRLNSVVLGPYTEDFWTKDLHYITLSWVAEVDDADEPAVTEPDKCECWEWFDWNDLPNPHSSGYDQLRAMGFDPVRYLD